MNPKLSYLSLAVLGSFSAYANDDIEVINVTGQSFVTEQSVDAKGDINSSDLAHWLDSVPGANINRNGPVTGIAQYRGLFGDRVAVTIDGQHIIGAGPNAMDAPLTYGNAALVEQLQVFRGIAPVSSGIDTLGGAIKVQHITPELLSSADWQSEGRLSAAYQSNSQAKKLNGYLNMANKEYAVQVFSSFADADNYDAAEAAVTPTEYEKAMYGIVGRMKTDSGELGFKYSYHDTGKSGTPALPMDIIYVETDRFSLDGEHLLAGWDFNWRVGYTDAAHVMDNFTMRRNMNAMMYRSNEALAETWDYALSVKKNSWELGLEGYSSEHDATITNPEVAAFRVANFNKVQEDRHSIYAQWQQQGLVAGIRIKSNNANAGEVSHHMAMMNANIGQLVNRFNQADRDVSDTTYDITASYKWQAGKDLAVILGAARKQRAASYQERYLWLPMEATAGLADGRTYVGDMNLDPETAYQLDLGVDWLASSTRVRANIYYQQIDDYIQATPLTDMAGRMVAGMMMSDNNPLQFANVEASLYGFDIDTQSPLTENLALSTMVRYVRGKRDDIDDNLYRIAPLNARVGLQYQLQNWLVKGGITAYASQNNVAAINQEAESSGYALVDVSADYYLSERLSLSFKIENALDKDYRSHLSGYYRPMNGSQQRMSRINGIGRNFSISANYYF